MAREDGFLSRWSRLKQEAAQPVPARPTPADAQADRDAAAARAAEAARLSAEHAAGEARERESLLAKLPKLEDLRADSDFSLFMHPLVPQSLRSAALARLWSLDAAIFSYEDPARDYAWNWNVPGGVPGGGPAPSAEEVQSTLREIFKRFDSEERVGDPPRPPEVAQASDAAQTPPASSDADPEPPPERADDTSAAQPAPVSAAAADTGAGPVADRRMPAVPEDALAADASHMPAPPPPRRRHGGAMPA